MAKLQGGNLVRKYIYGPGVDFPIMMINVAAGSETRYYYYRNELGSVIALLNNIGDVVEAYSYDPFGNPRVHTSAGLDGVWLTDDDITAINPVSVYGNRIMFTAREYDNESGLYYYRARMYHPQLGRFLQPDPLGYYDSMNLYQYCINNPVNWIDPYGCYAEDPSDIGISYPPVNPGPKLPRFRPPPLPNFPQPDKYDPDRNPWDAPWEDNPAKPGPFPEIPDRDRQKCSQIRNPDTAPKPPPAWKVPKFYPPFIFVPIWCFPPYLQQPQNPGPPLA